VNDLSQPLATSLLIALIGIGVFGADLRDAHACSPPRQGIFDRGVPTNDRPIPLDGAFTFMVYRYQASFDLLSVSVTNTATGAVAPGVFTQQPMGTGGASAPDDDGNFLVTWTPTEYLEPSTHYTVLITASDPSDPEHITTFPPAEFISGTDLTPESGFFTFSANSRLAIVEVPGGQECCDDSTVCSIGSCNSCRSCWFTQYDYLPSVTLTLAPPRQGDIFQVYYKLITSSTSFEVILGESSHLPYTHSFAHDAPGPFCLRVETYQLNSHQFAGSDEICFEREQFPDHEVRDYVGDGRPDTCDDEPTDPDAGPGSDAGPDAGSDVNQESDVDADPDTTEQTGDDIAQDSDIADQDATHTPDIGTDTADTDAENAFNGSITGGGCGCASTPGSPTPLASALLFLGALVGLRRRAVR